MFKLITHHFNEKFEFKTETMDEALSLAIDAFNIHHELQEINEDGEIRLLFCDLYHKIGKRYY